MVALTRVPPTGMARHRCSSQLRIQAVAVQDQLKPTRNRKRFCAFSRRMGPRKRCLWPCQPAKYSNGASSSGFAPTTDIDPIPGDLASEIAALGAALNRSRASYKRGSRVKGCGVIRHGEAILLIIIGRGPPHKVFNRANILASIDSVDAFPNRRYVTPKPGTGRGSMEPLT